jgi:uncharacterized protein YutE (UPF0331/DUF86 family)
MKLQFNQDTIRRLISELEGALNRLRELTSLPQEDFLADPHKIASSKYHFIVAIEAAIDIGNHLISKNRWRTPEDYADTFRVLGEEGFFEELFVRELIRMAMSRNRLVHLYWEVDDREVYRILTNRLGDLKRFMDGIGLNLKSSIQTTRR